MGRASKYSSLFFHRIVLLFIDQIDADRLASNAGSSVAWVPVGIAPPVHKSVAIAESSEARSGGLK